MSFRILNGNGDFMTVAWVEDGQLIKEESWSTRDKAEEALLLLKKYAIGGAVEQIHNLKIVEFHEV